MPVAEAILRLGHALYHDPAIDVEYAGTGGGYFMAQEDQDAVLRRTSWNTARPRSTRPDLISRLNAKGILCRTRRTCHIFWAIVSLEILITRTWKANQTAYGRTPRIGREEHSLGGAALAGLLRIRIWEAAFNSTSFLLSSSSLST